MSFLNVIPGKVCRLLLVLGVVATGAGCAAESSEPGEPALDDDDGSSIGESADELVGAKHHYLPLAPTAGWSPGCGIRLPNGATCRMGLHVDFTRKYIDLQVDTSVSVDNSAHVITVKLDTWSRSTKHPRTAVAMVAQQEPLEAANLQIGKKYTIRVVDWKGQERFHDTIVTMPAA